MADYRIEAPITLVAPFVVRVVAPITLIVPFMIRVRVPMTLVAPFKIRVRVPMTLIYKLPTVPCTTDDDCPIGYVCKNGVCVLENGNGEPETGWDRFLKWVEDNWALTAGGALAVSSLILLWPGGKKR